MDVTGIGRVSVLVAQDVKMGSAAMPQLSLACYSAADALQRMEGKQFICETKFDGAQRTSDCHVVGRPGQPMMLRVYR